MEKIFPVFPQNHSSPLIAAKHLYFGILLSVCCSIQARAQCNNNTVLSLSGPGTDTWQAPASGGPFSVRITATGAAGGAYLEGFPDKTGGLGATMSGTFIVQNGETLLAIAGGGGFHSQLEGGGGGGGTGVVNCGEPFDCGGGAILIIAAGGSGGQLGGPTGGFGLGGSSATNGDGNGGVISNSDCGGGGGALNGPGESAPSGGDGGGQVSTTGLAPGGEGSSNIGAGSGINDGGSGMGGGGGGGDGATTDNASGGGGGHTGGDGGNAGAASSFNSGGDPTNSPGATGGAPSGDLGTPSLPGSISVVCLQALPVELINFKAVIQSKEVRLLWSTATEKDNFGYDIERSADNRHWSAIGFAPGKGTTAIRSDYSFTDQNPQAGVNYYRLKQIDIDGKYEYSPMVIADLGAQGGRFDVFPNPSSTGELSIRAVSPREGDALLEIFDWVGYKVYKQKIYLYEGTIIYPLSLATFPKGTYTARLEMPDGPVQFRKIVLH